MRIACISMGFVLLIASSACSSNDSDDASGGAGGGLGSDSGVGADGNAEDEGGSGKAGGDSSGGSGKSASCVAGGEDVETMISEAFADFSIGGAYYIEGADQLFLRLDAQPMACGDTDRKPCLGAIHCYFSSKTPAPSTYDASGNSTTNLDGLKVDCSAKVGFADCSKTAHQEAKAGSTLTITSVDNGHIVGHVSVDFGTAKFEGDFDAAKYECGTPTLCVP